MPAVLTASAFCHGQLSVDYLVLPSFPLFFDNIRDQFDWWPGFPSRMCAGTTNEPTAISVRWFIMSSLG